MVERDYRTGEAPLFRALYVRQTWGGVPRNLFLINVLTCVFAVIILGTWFIGVVGIALHFLFRYFTSQDADFFDVFTHYLRSKNNYRSE